MLIHLIWNQLKFDHIIWYETEYKNPVYSYILLSEVPWRYISAWPWWHSNFNSLRAPCKLKAWSPWEGPQGPRVTVQFLGGFYCTSGANETCFTTMIEWLNGHCICNGISAGNHSHCTTWNLRITHQFEGRYPCNSQLMAGSTVYSMQDGQTC